MKMVRGFMEKMGGEDECRQMKQEFMTTMKEGTEEQKQEQWAKFGEKMTAFGEHAKEWKPEAGETWGGCGDKNWGADGECNPWKFKDNMISKWNSSRAKLISKPEGIHEATPGTTLFLEFEVMNDTNWAWKQDYALTLADEQAFTENPIEIVNVPIEQQLKSKCTMKVSFPLTVLPHIQADDEKIYTINLTFRGRKGIPIGEIIPVQLKVTVPKNPVDELDIYKLAIKLHEMNLGSFEECAKAVKTNCCDEAASIQALQRKV